LVGQPSAITCECNVMSSNSNASKVVPLSNSQARVCHRIGNHCGSTAIRDILEFHAGPVEEPPLCAAPHNEGYVEFMNMWSKLLFDGSDALRIRELQYFMMDF